MASGRENHDTDAMNSNMKSNPPRGGSVEVAARKFSKARSVAERLGICPRTIFRWADAGKITRYKINPRVVLFCDDEVAVFVASARVGKVAGELI
jgi:hypothetical protein